MLIGAAWSFPLEVRAAATLNDSRSALAALRTEHGAMTAVRRWPGMRDLAIDARLGSGHDVLLQIEAGVVAHRTLLLYLPDQPPQLARSALANDSTAAAKPPPGLIQTAQQKVDAGVAAMSRFERVTTALKRSATHMGPELRAAFEKFLTVDNLAIFAGLLLASAIANTNPVSGAIFDGAMIAFAYYQAGRAGIRALWLLGTTTVAAIGAKTEAQLDAAAKDYAAAIIGLGGAIFLAWLTRRMTAERSGAKVRNEEPAWPPNRGFVDGPVSERLPVGTRVDRYGYDGGTFVSPEGTPTPMRSLAPGTTEKPYNIYEVTKPLDVQAGKAAPWFGQPGMGVQYELPTTISEALSNGSIRRVGP